MNLVAIVPLYHDNLKGAVRAAVCPIAWYDGSRFIDAELPNQKAWVNKRAIFYRARPQFTVVQNGSAMGKIVARKLENVDFVNHPDAPVDCHDYGGAEAVIESPGDPTTLYNQVDFPADRNHALNDYDVSEKLAVAQLRYKTGPSEPLLLAAQQMQHYRADLLRMGHSLKPLRNFKLDRVVVLNLNHDGKPEVYGKLFAYVPTDNPQRKDILFLALLLDYQLRRPRLIGGLESVQRWSSWGSGDDLIGALDVDGDGVDELIVRHTGYEDISYQIYKVQNGKLKQVFSSTYYGVGP